MEMRPGQSAAPCALRAFLGCHQKRAAPVCLERILRSFATAGIDGRWPEFADQKLDNTGRVVQRRRADDAILRFLWDAVTTGPE